jgi:hypothetical protein
MGLEKEKSKLLRDNIKFGWVKIILGGDLR